jgi:hypothetical protein
VSAAAYRARSATELIDATFQLLRQNAAAFFTMAAMLTIPQTILQSIFIRPLLRNPTMFTTGGTGFGGLWIYTLCILALSAIFHTAMMYAADDAYLGKPIVVADELTRSLPKVVTLFFAYIVTGLCVGFAVIGFFVGSIYVGLMLFAVPAVIIFENTGIGEAMSRSSNLSKGLKGHIFVTVFLAGAVGAVGYIIVGFIAGLLTSFSTYAQMLVEALGFTIVVPIFPIAIVLLYYDARIRKEGFDIQLMAQAVDGSAAATTKPQPA